MLAIALARKPLAPMPGGPRRDVTARSFTNVHTAKRPPAADADGRLAWSEPLSLVALERVWSNTLVTDVQDDVDVTEGCERVLSPVSKRRRITAHLRTDVVEHYERGLSSRRVAALVGLGRTTVLEILKAAGVDIRPPGRMY